MMVKHGWMCSVMCRWCRCSELEKLSHLHYPSFPPGEEPGSGADIRELHLQLLLRCSPQLFCLPGADTGLLPSTSGEPDHCGHSSPRCPGPGSPGWSVGVGLPGAVHTVRSLQQMTCRHVLYQTGFSQYLYKICCIYHFCETKWQDPCFPKIPRLYFFLEGWKSL